MIQQSLDFLKKNNIDSKMSSGLSLGEYTALIDDRVFNFDDGVMLVKKRGEIMQEFTPAGNWKMAAILGLDEEKVIEACNETDGFVVPANFNTVGQVVISGEEDAVIRAGDLAKEKGARKISILNTAGPFHTEKLTDCSNKLKAELEKINVNKKDSKVVKNIDGLTYRKTDDVCEILANHIMNPVKFTNCLRTMYENGIDTFVEIGPGKTLSSFVKRMGFDKDIKIYNINNCESLEKFIMEVKENG